MTRVLNVKIKSLQLLKIIIFLSFIAIWLSVSTGFEDLLIFHNNKDLDLYRSNKFFKTFVCLHNSIIFNCNHFKKTNKNQ
jgi:hypothetical protein